MLWNQNTNDHTEHRIPVLLSGTVGSLMIAFAHMPLGATVVAPQAHPVSRGISVVSSGTSYTQQSSTIKVGLLQNDQNTLVSGPAKHAVGQHGLKRLESFLDLQAGWDGPKSKPIDLRSVEVFSRFFTETHLHPKQLGVFMSARGNVVVNWPNQDDQLIELEFHADGVDYFIESTGDEGTVSVGDIGFSKLFKLVSESV